MLKDLNKKPSTVLTERRIRDKLTINWQLNHGFKNLFDKYPHRNDKNADVTVFVTKLSDGVIDGKIIFF